MTKTTTKDSIRGLLLICVVALAFCKPVGTLLTEHQHADERMLWGIAHAANVLSNLPLLLVGLAGLLMNQRRLLRRRAGYWGYNIFFASLLSSGLTSMHYHLQPNDSNLFWDRLSISLACAGILDVLIAERWEARASLYLRPWLLLFAPLTVVWWQWTNQAFGMGDLRPYLFLQFSPLILAPLLMWNLPNPHPTRQAFMLAVACYILAKLAELADAQIYASTQHLISGHSLKHILAALAGYMLLRLLCWRSRAQASLQLQIA